MWIGTALPGSVCFEPRHMVLKVVVPLLQVSVLALTGHTSSERVISLLFKLENLNCGVQYQQLPAFQFWWLLVFAIVSAVGSHPSSFSHSCTWVLFLSLTVAFKIYDMDKDGYISNGELFQVLKMMVGNNLKDAQLQQIVDKTIIHADVDGDGKISFEEFCSVSCEILRTVCHRNWLLKYSG